MLQAAATPRLVDINRSSWLPSFQPELIPAGDAIALNFDGFCLLPRERLLFYSGERLRIGDRALDILSALMQRQGEVVSKSSLLEIVWPHMCVEENSLRVQMLGLRRILGDGEAGRRLIVTVVGRGYAFVGRIHCERSPRSGTVVGVDTLGDPRGL
jgi:DNA-binding winged helix-turn-helix (wHTH) protein